ncbi:hypothetical protein QO004_001999 [Rhizobium mesoamericanum]|nr:hypothetical protein [Rhizobium mesoamericanum]
MSVIRHTRLQAFCYWTDSEARAYLDSLRFAQAALRYAAARAGSGQAGGLLDCLVRCNAGVDPCVRSCRTIECLLGCQSEFFDCAKGCVTEAVRDILARNGSDGGKASPARPGRRRTEKKGVGD